MKKATLTLVLGLALGVQGANRSNGNGTAPPFKARKQFVLPNRVTEKDYLPKTIVFKLKPEYRSLASPGYVQHPQLQTVLDYLGVDNLGKIYPRHQPPKQRYNALGQAYADLSLIYSLKYTGDVNIVDAINQLLAVGIMEFAEPHYVYEVHYTPNDPSITNSGQSGFLTRIRAYAAWDTEKGNTNTVIAIVDSGTDIDHPDLVSQFALNTADPINGTDDDNDGYIDNYRGWDMAGADFNTLVGDNDPNITGNNNNHGSHVSGCASAATDNSVGVAGPGFKCRLLPVKAAADNDTQGSGGAGLIRKGYESITYAADHGAKIINCSWGGSGGGSYGQTIIDYATVNKNCLVVASAGNSNIDEANYPGSFNYVLSVAATNSTNDTKAGFSTYNYTVDISTPGNGIYTTLYNNTYGNMSGTSMSSPITAGGAGLVYSKFNYTNALQIGQRLKATSDNHYAAGTNITGTGNTQAQYQGKLGKGRMNLQRALTDPTALSVVFANEKFTDKNDDAFVIGDNLYISGDFVNYLDPINNLTANISVVTGATYLTAVTTTATIGSIPTLQKKDNSANPFQYTILAGTPQNTTLVFKVTLTDGSGYTDSYFISVVVNVDYINININDVATTITSKGKIGYNADNQQQGLGFSYNSTPLLYEASLMIGSSASAVSDAFRGGTAGASDADFQSVKNAYKIVPGVKSEFDVHGVFKDAPASPTQNVQVRHAAFAWTTVGNRKYVIVDYTLKNTGTTALNNLYAGIAADWDIDAATSAKNKGDFDASRKLGYVYSTVSGGKYAGVKLLTNTAPVVCYHIDNVNGGGGAIDINDANNLYSTADKYATLSTNRLQGGTATAEGTDIISVVSSGPFTINANDSVRVAFALIAGEDLKDIQNSADSAQTHYTSNVVGIQKQLIEAAGGAIVYPNPVASNLSFEFAGNATGMAEVTLFNAMGEVVRKVNVNCVAGGIQHFTLDVADLPNGAYMYQLSNGSKLSTGKVLISK